MIIDFHTHIFPDAIAEKSIAALSKRAQLLAATNGTLQGLLDSMERDGVDISVIQPVVTKPSQFHTVNTFAASLNKQYADKLISFGGIHPECEDYKKELDFIKELGLPGIKLHPDYQRVMFDDEKYLRIVEYADYLDLIILTHAGIDIGLPDPVHCTPDRIRHVIDILHPKKLVAAHYGGWRQWDMVYDLLAGQDIYLDLSFSLQYMEEETFHKILEKHGHKKILFATDSPWAGQKEQVDLFLALGLPADVQADILYKNAKKLLNME